MKTTPTRFQKHNFDPLAPIIGRALAQSPSKCLELEPLPGIARSTFIRRLRESLIAKRLYFYQHPSIDETLWQTFGSALTVSDAPSGKIFFGTKQAIKEQVIGTGTLPSAYEYEFQHKTFNDLESLCFLWKHFVLPKPAIFVRIPASEQAALEARQDIAFYEQDGKQFLL
jgi:hypothetical protein